MEAAVESRHRHHRAGLHEAEVKLHRPRGGHGPVVAGSAGGIEWCARGAIRRQQADTKACILDGNARVVVGGLRADGHEYVERLPIVRPNVLPPHAAARQSSAGSIRGRIGNYVVWTGMNGAGRVRPLKAGRGRAEVDGHIGCAALAACRPCESKQDDAAADGGAVFHGGCRRFVAACYRFEKLRAV
eukprot:4707133-Prymnesium_polylepis.1